MKHDITKQKQYHPAVQALVISLLILIIAIGLVGVAIYTTGTINAEKAPPNDIQHWLLENDGDMAYLLTQPGCYLIQQELGPNSRVFTLECDPVKDGQ